MTSSTWTSEPRGRLIGCGVDAERPGRFDKLRGEERPWPLVFSEREAVHARSLPDPSLAYCAAFCCKEAVIKALETTYALPECEAFFDPCSETVSVELSAGLRERHAVSSVSARFLRLVPDEVAAAVHLYGNAVP